MSHISKHIKWEGKVETIWVRSIAKVLVLVWGHWRGWRVGVSVTEAACTGDRVLRGWWWKMKDASLRLEEHVGRKKGLSEIGLRLWNEGFLEQRWMKGSNATVDMAVLLYKKMGRRRRKIWKKQSKVVALAFDKVVVGLFWRVLSTPLDSKFSSKRIPE